MCAVSAIGDNWRDTFQERWRQINPSSPSPIYPYDPFLTGQPTGMPVLAPVNRTEFEALKKEVEELKELLKAAKKFDEATGQKDCEMDDKVAFIKKIAEFVGVNMNDVFKT